MMDTWIIQKRAQRTAFRSKVRAKRHRVKSDLTTKQIVNLFNENHTCYYCKKPITSAYELSIDHVVPMCRGGENTLKNVIVCCDICNLQKGKREEREFLLMARHKYH
jgi:5-methylcytosine-specific restriction endonuclease McrA